MVTFRIFTYLCIRQAALGNVRASSLAARLHYLCKCCFVVASVHGR